MMRVTNYTLTDGEMVGKGYVRDRLRSVRTILMTLFTIAFSLVALVYGELLLNIVFGAVVGEDISKLLWMLLRWPLAIALYFLMISYNYYILPVNKVRFRDIVPGSIFAAIGFVVVTYVYTIYTSISTNYDILYGSFSNIVALMFWFWFLAWVMCLGVSFNRVWWATRKTNNIPMSEDNRERRKASKYFLIYVKTWRWISKTKNCSFWTWTGPYIWMTGCLTVSVISWKRCGENGEDIFS